MEDAYDVEADEIYEEIVRLMNEDKVKIFEIIQKKCAEYKRKDFEFYQAYYCNTNKNIQFKKLNIGIGGN